MREALSISPGSSGEPTTPPPTVFAAVIPTYQREATIGRAVESVLAQTYPAAAVIVVDDGSTDGTLERLGAFGDQVHVVSQLQSGSSVARNRGVSEASADWIAFLDSDDQWEPDHLERVAEAILETGGRADLYFRDTEVEVVSFDAGEPRLEVGSYWVLAEFDADGTVLVDDGSPWVLAPTQPMVVSSSVIRRSRYVELGGMRQELRLRHDTYLYFRLGLGRPICAISGVGARMTDDAAATRLTRGVTPLARSYWDETALMYDDLARRFARGSPARKEFDERLATAHWRIAKIELMERNFGQTIRSLIATLRTLPLYAPRRVVARSRGAFGQMARRFGG